MDKQKMDVGSIVDLVLRAVAVAMSVTSIVIGFIGTASGTASAETQVTLLSIGLFTLALSALDKADA